MDSLRVCAGVALSLAVLCSSERPNVIAREAATGSLTGRVHVVAHPARRLATAGAYPGRIVGIQGERETSELDNVVVFVSSAMRADSTPQRVSIRQTNEEFIPHVVAVTTGSTARDQVLNSRRAMVGGADDTGGALGFGAGARRLAEAELQPRAHARHVPGQ